MPTGNPNDWLTGFREALTWLPAAAVWAYLARIAFHIHRHISGKKRLTMLVVVAEVPIAIFMGFAGAGLGEWLGLTGKAYVGLIAVLGWLGPSCVEWLFDTLAKRHLGEAPAPRKD